MHDEKLKKYGLAIADSGGRMGDLDEIIGELLRYKNESNFSAMSDYQLFLQGRKAMLEDIVEWLNAI